MGVKVIRKMLKLEGILQSTTTLSQFQVTLPLAILFTLLGLVIPEWSEPASASSVITALAPLISRCLLWKKK